MKNLVLILFAALMVGFASFGVYYSWQKSTVAHAIPFDELSWLRTEFDLTEEQMRQIEEIHAKYRPICEMWCGKVMAAQTRFEQLVLKADDFTGEVDAALAEFSRVKEACHRSMLQHVFEVAAIMEPNQRERYLTRVKAQVTMHDRGAH
jgi:Spy/CpxP family protein refolding chaperone